MSSGFALVVERIESGPSLFREIAIGLAPLGFGLHNPITQRATKWTADGEQREVTEEEIVEALNTDRTVLVQFWMTADVDVACSLTKVTEGIWGSEFALDGLDPASRDSLAGFQIARFHRLASQHAALLLVVDRSGETEDYDWLAVAVNGLHPEAPVPDVLGIT
jgi:hypothetical protein